MLALLLASHLGFLPALAAVQEEAPAIIVIGRRAKDGVPVVPWDSIGSRDVFGPEEVRETGAREVNDLVRSLPAISTRPYNGGEAAAPSFSMRGLPDDGLTEYVNVLIDGVPASPLPYGWTAFSFLPITPERIYAIDYIRGAHSVRYSPNTVGGVLNFITQPIPDSLSVGARSTYGTNAYASNMIWTGNTVDDLGYLVSYVDRRGDGYRDNGGFEQQDFNLKLRRDLGEGDFFASSLSYMDDEHQAPGGLTQAQYDADPFGNARPENRFEGYRGVADLVYHDRVSMDGWWEGFTYYSQTFRHLRAKKPNFPLPGDTLTISDWRDTTYFVGLGVRGETSFDALGMEHTLHLGARAQKEWLPSYEIESEPFSGGAGTPTQDSEYYQYAYSIHADDTFHPTENLTVTAGARVEWVPTAKGDNSVGAAPFEFDDSFFTVLPGVGASYLLADEWALFGNYFEGFRSPQVWGFGSTPAPALADIDFEEAKSWELGTRAKVGAGVSGQIAYWQNKYEDFFVFYSGFYENLGEIRAKGADVQLIWDFGEVSDSLKGLTIGGSFTSQDAEIRSGPNAGKEVPYAWNKKAAWRASYEFLESWSASLGGTYVGESFSDEANTVAENANGNLGLNPDVALWDARLAKDFQLRENGFLRIAVGATNLFDENWFVHSRGGFFGPGKVAGPPFRAYVSFDITLTF